MQRQHMPSWFSTPNILRFKGIVPHLCLLLSSACPAMGGMSTLSCDRASCAKEAISGRSLVQVRSGFIFKTEDSPDSSLTATDQAASRNSGEPSDVQAPSDDSVFLNETEDSMEESMLLSSSVLLNRPAESLLLKASAGHNETAELMLSRSSVLHNETAESVTLTNHVLNNESSKSASIKHGYESAAPASLAGLLETQQEPQHVVSWTQQLASLLRLRPEEKPRRSKSTPESGEVFKGEEVEQNKAKGRSELFLAGFLFLCMCGRIFSCI